MPIPIVLILHCENFLRLACEKHIIQFQRCVYAAGDLFPEIRRQPDRRINVTGVRL
ncbi:MAG: hypothetical protein FWD61_03295 [Phycisphaerales bacterium]|nr:hypothetical protein [Phycisphaerales bacterium]